MGRIDIRLNQNQQICQRNTVLYVMYVPRKWKFLIIFRLFGWPVKGQALRRNSTAFGEDVFSLKVLNHGPTRESWESFQGAVSIQCFEAVSSPYGVDTYLYLWQFMVCVYIMFL